MDIQHTAATSSCELLLLLLQGLTRRCVTFYKLICSLGSPIPLASASSRKSIMCVCVAWQPGPRGRLGCRGCEAHRVACLGSGERNPQSALHDYSYKACAACGPSAPAQTTVAWRGLPSCLRQSAAQMTATTAVEAVAAVVQLKLEYGGGHPTMLMTRQAQPR